MSIPTPHIDCDDKSKIAKVVLMPGDPLRAKMIADTYLTDFIQINGIRNMLGYTGKYKGKRITVMGSGMGMPSIGIYSFELFKFYDVETIIRIGSAGSYTPELKLKDVILVDSAYSDSNYAKVATGISSKILKPSKAINNKLKKTAEKLNITLKEERIYSSDVFYSVNPDRWKRIKQEKGCACVEMESFALFANAKAFGRKAAALLTISDSLLDTDMLTPLERQKSMTDMILIALELAKN